MQQNLDCPCAWEHIARNIILSSLNWLAYLQTTREKNPIIYPPLLYCSKDKHFVKNMSAIPLP